jgi:hypothetical protein
MNYRSVMLFGVATETTDVDEKRRAFEAIVDHVCAGRSKDVRAPDDNEMRATLVLSLPIIEASAKVRSGPPVDAERDYALPCWAGVLPLRTQPQTPIPDARLSADIGVPSNISEYVRPNARKRETTSPA